MKRSFARPRRYSRGGDAGASPTVAATVAGAATANDYFVVFDEYGRADQLLDAFGFDVAPFQDVLRPQGFKIVARTHANLPMPHLSLTTTPGMDYVVPVGSGVLDGVYG